MTSEQWRWLITGVDWQRLCAHPPAHWQVQLHDISLESSVLIRAVWYNQSYEFN